ncbi:unnamed protein product, partial [Effrenium voratum]
NLQKASGSNLRAKGTRSHGTEAMTKDKKLDYQGRAFSDGDLQELPLKDVVYPYEEVNFSQNQLSAEGLRKVLELCSRCENLRILKLYKNDITDDGAQALGRFVRCCETMEELHLSHNRFTERGVEVLVKAAEEARRHAKVPMWVRLEQNDVSNPEKVMADLQDRCSVCPRKNRNKCTNRVCIHNCKVHLPHFHFQRDEFGQANNDGPRKRKWQQPQDEDYDAWKDTDWREGRDDWFDGRPEAFRKVGPDWEDKTWDARPEPRPAGVKMSGGIFMRAMGAIVKKTDDEDGRPSPSVPSKPRVVPNNVASRTLSNLGVLERRKSKVQLTEAPKSFVKKEDEDEEDEDVNDDEVEEEDEGKAASEEKEVEEEEEMEEEDEEKAPPRGKDREAEDHRRVRGMHADREDRGRRRESPRRERREARDARGARDARDRGAPAGRDRRDQRRRHEGRRDERRQPDRADRDRRRREPERDRSRRRRSRSRRARERREERQERREERRDERREDRKERREERREERPRRRDERAAAGERTEKLLETMQGTREKKRESKATKQEPDNKQAPAVPFVATRAKAAPRRPQAGAPPAPRPKVPARPAPVASKAKAKAAGAADNVSEYTYTEA